MKLAYIHLHLAVLLAACSSIFGNLIKLDAIMITWYRMMLAAVILVLFLFLKKEALRLRRDDLRSLATGLLLGLHWIMFYASIKFANVSIGVVCFTLSGFFTALLAPLLNHKSISVVEFSLSTLTLLGISLIFHFDSSFRLGISCGVVSALLFAIYATFNGKEEKGGSVYRNTLFQMLGGTAGIGLLLPVYRLFNPVSSVIPSPTDLGCLLALALGCTVCMCILLNKAQKIISPFSVSIGFNLEPVYSIFLAMLIFHEDKMLGTAFYAGLSLIVLSLLLQMTHVACTKS